VAPAGYDALDGFLNGLLHPGSLPPESLPLEPGMVDFRKTPARIALELFERSALAPGQLFCDLGSGLGQIPILAHLVAGARALGIEREPAYTGYAAACAADLGLSAVEFRSEDARAADYGNLDVLFLYTPFRGRILEEVLERIRRQGREGLRVFALGPCASDLAGREWLIPREPGPDSGSGLRGFIRIG
jgi:Histone methylation protein DOT1